MEDDPVVADIKRKIDRERLLIQAAQRMRAQANPSMQSSIDNQIREGGRNVEYLESRLRELQMRRMNDGMSNMSVKQGNGSARPISGSGGRPTVTAVPSQGQAPQGPRGQGGYQGQGQQSQYAGGYARDEPNYGNPPAAGYSDLHAQGQLMPARPPFTTAPAVGVPKGRPQYSRLDLIKYDTPFLGPRIQLMLSQLEFKLSVEKQYEEGILKIMGSYKMDGDRKIRQEAAQKKNESAHKIQLLQRSLKKYEDLHVDMESSEDVADDDSMNAPALRKPLTGVLSVRVHEVSDIAHSTAGSRFGKGPETFVAMKVEEEVKARTKATRTDRWADEYHEIDIEKGNEIELTVYDKSGSDAAQPVALLWIRISDIADEMRRKKVENELASAGWVSANRTVEGEQANRPDLRFQPPPGSRGGSSTPGSNFAGPGFAGANVQPQNGPVVIDAWFSCEPVGRIHLSMSFAKQSRERRPFDAGLHRKGAVRQRKEEVHELYGHKFIAQQFYNIMRCALCGELLKYSTGMQCADCTYLCHEKCYSLVVTKCISKSNAESDPDEAKINHRIPHRFETYNNIGANWCCHCGYMLPLGRKTKRCRECKLTCHSSCTHLVPDFCGMSMKDANRILAEIKKVDGSRTGPGRMTGRNLRTGKPPVQTPRPTPSSMASYIGGTDAEVRKTGPPGKHLSYEERPGSDDRTTSSHSMMSLGSSASTAPTSATMFSSGPSDLSLSAARHTQGSAPQMLSPAQQYEQRPQVPRMTSSSAAAMAAANALAGRPSPSPGISSPSRDYVSHQPNYSGRGSQQPVSPEAQRSSTYDSSARRDVDKGFVPSVPSQTLPSQAPKSQMSPQITEKQQPTPQQDIRAPTAQSQVMVPPTPITQFVEQRNQPGAPQMRGTGKRIGLDHFNFLAVLGKGNFGKVMLAETKHSKQLYAIKVLKKEFIIENDEVESTRSERDVFIIANKARHPFLLSLHACFQTETRVYFVMEYISGGDLMLHIQRGQFGAKRAQFYAAEVCLALKYFHENGVVYRDLKLDNIMLTLDGHIKVADYGLCKKDMYYGSTTSTFCGTPEFMAPEILLDKRYGRAVDWWAFGVLIYQMLLQQSPFRGEDEDEIYDAILSDEPLYPINMPHDSVSILQKLLTREPEQRLGSGPTDAQEIMSHPFFKDINWESIYHKREPAPFLPKIKSATDTSNFDSEFTSVTPVLTPVNSVLSQAMQEEFRGFSYSAEDFV